MLKTLCIGSFIAGLLASIINYTINYFGVEEQVEQEKHDIIKGDI